MRRGVAAPTRSVIAALAVLALAIAVVLPASSAVAAPAASRTIPSGAKLVATGGAGQASTDIAIPAGLTPVRVSGKVTAAADSPGTVDIYVGGRIVAKLPALRGGSFSAAISAADVTDGRLRVEIRNRLATGEGRCVSDSTSVETLSGLAVTVQGTATPPSSIGTFFSPAVGAALVVIPAQPSPQLSAAGLAAVGAVASRYPSSTSVRLTAGTPAPAELSTLAAGPDPRVIVIGDGPNPVSTKLSSLRGIPALSLTGSGDELAAAARALASPALGLAGAQSATGLAESGRAEDPLRQTLADLGAGEPTLTGIGRISYTVGVSQSRFGGPVSDYEVALTGTHTPVPPSGQVTASVLWNERLVSSVLLGNDDRFSATVKIPSDLVRRDNALTLRMDVTPPGGRCDVAVQPVQLDLLGGSSTVTATRGQSLPPGFDRFPQVLGGALPVALGSSGAAAVNVVYAADILAALQRLTPRQLAIRLVDAAAFISSHDPGLIVGAAPDQASALDAPLRLAPFRAVNTAGTEFTVTVDGPFAALEAFSAGGRDVLMLGGYSPQEDTAAGQDQVEGLTGSLATGLRTPAGFFVVSQNLLIAQPGQAPVTLNADSVVPQREVTDAYRGLPAWLWVGAGIVLALAVARVWYVHRRRAAVQAAVDEQLRHEAELALTEGGDAQL